MIDLRYFGKEGEIGKAKLQTRCGSLNVKGMYF